MVSRKLAFALPLTPPPGIFPDYSAPTSVRKVKEGEVNADLFGFLTFDLNAIVAPIQPKRK